MKKQSFIDANCFAKRLTANKDGAAVQIFWDANFIVSFAIEPTL